MKKKYFSKFFGLTFKEAFYKQSAVASDIAWANLLLDALAMGFFIY